MSTPAERAWAFELDGHIFYVLNDIEGKTYLFDARTGQWCRWFTGASLAWNFRGGISWRGRTIGHEEDSNRVLEIDPYLEQDVDGEYIARRVSAFLPVRGDDSYRQGSMRVNASVGSPVIDELVVSMRFSDNEGNDWIGPFEVALLLNEFTQPVEYRSLGRMRAPGRLWEVSDVGGLIRIDGCDSTHEVPEENNDNQS